MRRPSQADARMPPAGTGTRCPAPSSAANSSVSSPSTKAAVRPMKWMPMTGAPAATARVCSTIDGTPLSVLAISPASRRARLEALPDLVLRQITADEHDAALALLVVAPFALVVAVQDHVH